MQLYFGLIGIALLAATFSGAALAWDGSYYLYKVLDTGQPFAPPGRFIGYVLHPAVLVVRAATDDPIVLQAVFGLTYTAVPLAALAASWWVVRQQAPSMFIWAAFGIGIGLLPGMFYLVGEGVLVVALIWPVLLALLLRLPTTALLIAIPFAGFTFLAHPLAAPLFLIVGAVAAWIGVMSRGVRGRMLAAATCLGLAAGLRLLVQPTALEVGAPELSASIAAFDTAFQGYPILIVGAAWFTASMVVVAALMGKSADPDVARIVRLFQYVGLALAGILALDWARHPRLWANGLQFAELALVSSFPFMLLAIVEGFLGQGFLVHRAVRLMEDRLPLIRGSAAIVVGTLAVQGIHFSNLTSDLDELVRQSSVPCISTSSLGTLHGTPLGHWSVSSLALVLQGRTPRKLLLEGEGCVVARSSGVFRVVEWDRASGGNGWFDLSDVRSRVEATGMCWYSISPGWYGVERGWYADWWRWSAGAGQIQIFAERPLDVVMRADLRSLRQPNRVEIVLNGVHQASQDLVLDSFTPMTPLAVNLSAGKNVVEIQSSMPALQVAKDARPLALAIRNVTIAPWEQNLVCELQP